MVNDVSSGTLFNFSINWRRCALFISIYSFAPFNMLKGVNLFYLSSKIFGGLDSLWKNTSVKTQASIKATITTMINRNNCRHHYNFWFFLFRPIVKVRVRYKLQLSIEKYLKDIKYIYTEVNTEQVYVYWVPLNKRNGWLFVRIWVRMGRCILL